MSSNYIEFVEEIQNFIISTGARDSQYFKFDNTESEFSFYIIRQQSITHLSDCLMIYPHKSNNANIEAKLLSKISILDVNDRKFNTEIIGANFTLKNEYSPIRGGVYFIEREQILEPKNGLLVDGTLRIHFEVELLNGEISSSKILNPKVDKTIDVNPREKALEDYESLLESCKHSDVLFVIGKDDEKKEFHLHKNILATRSDVFDAMLKVDCEEKRNGRVDITDMTVPVFEEMIRYIYTGKIGPGLELYTEELFEAADKYQLEILKKAAAHELSSKLSIESVSGVLLLADMHSDQQLKTDCIKHINKHAKEVLQTETWKVMIKTRADLMFLLYQDVVDSK